MGRALVILAATLFIGACGGRKVKVTGIAASKAGTATVRANWVKDKGKKWDVELAITNEHSRGMIILLKEMKCYRGETEGTLKHTFFNTGERTIDFGVGQTKSFRMVCDVHEKATGDFRISIGRLYDNPTNDGKTTGDVIGHDLEWRAPGT